MLTLMAMLAGPIVIGVILMIAAAEIKDAWDRINLG